MDVVGAVSEALGTFLALSIGCVEIFRIEDRNLFCEEWLINGLFRSSHSGGGSL